MVGRPSDVLAAVSCVLRVSAAELAQRGPARTLYAGMARDLCVDATCREMGALVGLSEQRIWAQPRPTGPAARAIRLVAGDPRFALIDGTASPRPRPARR